MFFLMLRCLSCFGNQHHTQNTHTHSHNEICLLVLRSRLIVGVIDSLREWLWLLQDVFWPQFTQLMKFGQFLLAHVVKEKGIMHIGRHTSFFFVSNPIFTRCSMLHKAIEQIDYFCAFHVLDFWFALICFGMYLLFQFTMAFTDDSMGGFVQL